MGAWCEAVDVESLYLKTLVEVVRTGSLSRAAETLHVTQPAVSRRIKFMEDQYGCALLDRSGSTLRPTSAGELVYQKAKALLDIEADLVAGLHLLGGKTKIAFSSTPAFGSAHLPAILREFMLTCGDTAELKFMFSTPPEMLQGLNEGLFDAAVMESCELFDLSSFGVYPLPEAELVFASAPSLGLPTPDTAIEALLDVPLFTRREGCCSRTLLDRGLKGIGRDVRAFKKLIVLDDLHMLIEAVLSGEGVSFLSRDLLTEHLAAGRMRVHVVPGFQHSRQRALVVGQPEAIEGPLAELVGAVLARFGVPGPAGLKRAPVRGQGQASACGCGAEVSASTPSRARTSPKAASRRR